MTIKGKDLLEMTIKGKDLSDAVMHINTDQEIYFSIKDINQKETMVSISEMYRVLRNIETLLGRKEKENDD